MRVLFNLLDEAEFIERLNNGFAGGEAVLPGKTTGVLVHHAAAVHHRDSLKLVTVAYLEIVRIVRGRDFHRAGPELRVHLLVGDDGDLTIHQRQDDHLADQVLVAFVFGMHGHGRIAQHGLGAGRGHNHEPLGHALERIPEIPQVSLDFVVLDFDVGEGGLVPRAPVDDVLAAVN